MASDIDAIRKRDNQWTVMSGTPEPIHWAEACEDRHTLLAEIDRLRARCAGTYKERTDKIEYLEQCNTTLSAQLFETSQEVERLKVELAEAREQLAEPQAYCVKAAKAERARCVEVIKGMQIGATRDRMVVLDSVIKVIEEVP